MSLQAIEKLAVAHGDAHQALIKHVTAYEAQLANLDAGMMPEMRKLVRKASATEAALLEAVKENRDLFESPKSLVIAGIRFGFKKGSGGYEIEDEEDVIERIEKMFPKAKDRENLLQVTTKLLRKGLDDLDGSTLKKLGVVVEDTGDVAFVKPAESKLSKVVKSLLKVARKAD